MAGTVDMRLEPHAFVGLDLACVAEGEDLESAAVGEDGAVPAVEPVQSACRFNHLHAGTEIKMVGVAEDDLCFHFILQIVHVDSFHGAQCPDGHKNGGADFPVVGGDDACPCRAFFVGFFNNELHFVSILRQKYTKIRNIWNTFAR